MIEKCRAMMMLSCREAKRCLHMIPECVCDGDPTMPDIVDRLHEAKACTQKTFLHSPDWAEGRKLLDEAAAEIVKLRAALRLAPL